MSAYYDLYETPAPKGGDDTTPKSKPLHARIHSKGTITAEEFIERVVKEQHMPHVMVVSIMQAISNALGDWLAEGYNVELDELGFFSTTLKCAHPVSKKSEIRAESVHFETVKFRPSKRFKRYIDRQMTLERLNKKKSYYKKKVVNDIDTRKQKLLSFLASNICITRADYARLVHITDRRATYDLQEFLASGIICKRGGGRSIVYTRAVV